MFGVTVTVASVASVVRFTNDTVAVPMREPGAYSNCGLTDAFPLTTGTFAASTVAPIWNVTVPAAVVGETVASISTRSEYCFWIGVNVRNVPVPAALFTVNGTAADVLERNTPVGR